MTNENRAMYGSLFTGDEPGNPCTRLPDPYSKGSLAPSHFDGWEAVEVAKAIMAHHGIRDYVSTSSTASRPLTRVIPIAERLLERCQGNLDKAKRQVDAQAVARELMQAGFTITLRK